MKLMKLTTGFLLLLLPALAGAQIHEEYRSMSQGSNNAIILEIPEVEEKLVSRVWQDYLDDFYDTKIKWNRREGEWSAEEADIVALGLGKAINIYSTIDQKGKGVEVAVWVDLGDNYLSSKQNPERYTEAEKLMMRFGLEVARAEVRQDIDEQEKQLSRMESELRKLASANDRYHKDIERAQEAIRKAEENIVKNERDQEETAAKIELQKELINEIRTKLNDL